MMIICNVLQSIKDSVKGVQIHLNFPKHLYKKDDDNLFTNDWEFVCYHYCNFNCIM